MRQQNIKRKAGRVSYAESVRGYDQLAAVDQCDVWSESPRVQDNRCDEHQERAREADLRTAKRIDSAGGGGHPFALTFL